MVISNEEKQDRALRDAHLVEPDHLDELKSGAVPNRIIIDMRGIVQTFSVAAPIGASSTCSETVFQDSTYSGARNEYDRGHIPGAVYLDWTRDIVDLLDPVPVQVGKPEQLALLFGSIGIGNDTEVIAYDSHPSFQFATRLWWVFKYLGNSNLRVLNGGWQRWVAENRPVSLETPRYLPQIFTANPQTKWLADSRTVLDSISDTACKLIDARDERQYSGEITRGIRGGHIPGAISLPREKIFSAPGFMKSSDALRTIMQKCGITNSDGRRVIAYCNGGVAATSVLFALSSIGYSNLTNYDGSWNEWNVSSELPIVS